MAEGKLRPDGHANPLERARAAARGPREEDPTAEARRARARQGAQGPRFIEEGDARSLGGAQGIREGHRALPQTAPRRGRAALRRPPREASGGEGIPRPRADVPRGVPRWKEDEGHRRGRARGAVPRGRVRKEPRQCRQGARPPPQERGSPRRRRSRALPHGLLLRASGGRRPGAPEPEEGHRRRRPEPHSGPTRSRPRRPPGNAGFHGARSGRRMTVVVLLAAGRGVRMRSERPKVLHEAAGRPLLDRVLDTAKAVAGSAAQVVVVVSKDGDAVAEHVKAAYPGVRVALQNPPRGTGDAVRVAAVAFGKAKRV